MSSISIVPAPVGGATELPLPPSGVGQAADLVRIPHFQDEEVDHDIETLESRLDLPNFLKSDHHEIGALAFHSNASHEDLYEECAVLYEKSLGAVEFVRKTKVDLLAKRIAENTEKLAVFRSLLGGLDSDVARCEARLDEIRERRASAWASAVRNRLEAIGTLAGRRQRAVEKLGTAQPGAEESVAGRRPLYAMNEDLKEIPASQNEARIAYLWNRILQFRRDNEESRILTTGLERNGISFVGARFLVWCGFSIVIGAGGAIGALLQESDIGNHMLEHFLAAVQLRLGFVVADPNTGALKTASNSALVPGIVLGLGVIVGFVLFILALLWLTGSARRRLGFSDEDDEASDDGSLDGQPTRGPDTSPWTAGILRVVFDGHRSVLRLLPGIGVFAVGLLLLLAFGPSFNAQTTSTTFSLTRTSIGVVFALSVAAVAQILFLVSVFPLLRERILAGSSLSLISPRAAAVTLMAFVGLSGSVIALGPVLSHVPPSAGNASVGVPHLSPGTVGSSLPPHVVWCVSSIGLLLSCCILSMGNVFRGIYLRGQWLERRLFRLETQFADKIQAVLPSTEFDSLETEIGHKWRSDFDSDVVLKRILLSGVFSPEELKPLFDSHSELLKLMEESSHIEDRLKELRAEKDRVEKDIWSRERSTNNYENRVVGSFQFPQA